MNIFLDNIKNKIENGEYDKYLTIPLISRKLIYASIKGRIERHIKKGQAPILSESEILLAINDAKETSSETFKIFVKAGILEKNKNKDGYELTSIGKSLTSPHI